MKEPGGTSIIPNDPPLRQVEEFNSEAWSQIFDRHYESVYRYAYRRLGEVEAAQSVASDAFYRLLVAYQNGSGPRDGILFWLYRAAHNLVIDQYRRSAQDVLSLEEALHSAGGSTPEETLEDRQEHDLVRAALVELTREQQQVVTLKFLEGFENEEVAEIMQVSIGAVKALQHRALASLSRILDGKVSRRRGRSRGAGRSQA